MINYDLKGLQLCIKCLPTHWILYVGIGYTLRNLVTQLCIGSLDQYENSVNVVAYLPTSMDLPSVFDGYDPGSVHQYFRTWQRASTKGASWMRLWGKPAMTWPIWLDAGRSGTDTIGSPVQDLSNFRMATIPFLSDLTCSTHSPHDILTVWKKWP